jgi:uncharacterized protein
LDSPLEIPKPIIGRTYSLYSQDNSTNHFYEQIRYLNDLCLSIYPNKLELLKVLQHISKKHAFLKKEINVKKNPKLSKLLSNLKSFLGVYIKDLENHLSNLSIRKKFDKTLSTSEFQYYLYMIELELVNRIFKEDFINSERKIALLPHCLRDLSHKCMSEHAGKDYVCKSCSKNCYINFTSKTLKEFKVEPYIWMTASQRKLFKGETGGKKRLGVLGIACIPELIRGMRMCLKKNIPVVGIPLDANRCARWMGEFHSNTINLEKLKELVS